MKFVALVILMSLSACLKDETISGQSDASEVWALVRMNETEISTPITLTFPEKGKIAGRAPCNRYFASQNAPLPWFEAGPIAATKVACPELALESLYFQTLASITLIERTGDVLLLNGDQGEVLEFRLET